MSSTPLFLHIGLPKTATSFWQAKVMPHLRVCRFIHAHALPSEAPEVLGRSYKFFKGGGATDMRLLPPLVADLETVFAADPRPLLISRENFSVLPSAFWRGVGPDPFMLADRIRHLDAALPDHHVRVLWGYRDAPAWLASRYAQSARSLPDPGQADFENRLDRICSPGHVAGPCLWLNRACVEAAFADFIARGHVHSMPMDALKTDPDSEVRRLCAFVGEPAEPLLAQLHADNVFDRKVNVKSTSANSWVIPNTDKTITLSPTRRASIEDALASAWPARAA